MGQQQSSRPRLKESTRHQHSSTLTRVRDYNALNLWRREISLFCTAQGSPGISEITRGRIFFLSRPGHPPLLSWAKNGYVRNIPRKHIRIWYLFQEKHIWIWYLVVSLLSTPVKVIYVKKSPKNLLIIEAPAKSLSG